MKIYIKKESTFNYLSSGDKKVLFGSKDSYVRACCGSRGGPDSPFSSYESVRGSNQEAAEAVHIPLGLDECPA